jgi:hypothetical protein
MFVWSVVDSLLSAVLFTSIKHKNPYEKILSFFISTTTIMLICWKNSVAFGVWFFNKSTFILFYFFCKVC